LFCVVLKTHIMQFVKVAAIVAVVAVAASSSFVGSMDLVRSVNQNTKLWTASMSSPVAYLTHDEFRGLIGAGPEGFRPASEVLRLQTYTTEDYLNAPESYDPRDHYPNCSSMKMIRDQSACGSCWAVGSVAAISDRTCIAEKADIVLSAEDMLACSGGGGCNGGQPTSAFVYWHRDGVVTEACRPYPFPSCDHHIPGSKNPCPSKDYRTPSCKRECKNGKNWKKDKHYAKDVYYVKGHDNIVTELATKGPCEASFAVYEDFAVYTSGIYHHTTGRLLGYHAVKLLGYGVHNGNKYWLLANSWNTHWGEKGFFRMLRGNNECGIESEVVGGVAKSA